ncbi:alpha/beta hydrolase family esterase [Oceaniglobus roseus]|uniref:alpha/beta hydrolase family esterase n=1 Tax=Oceaniglobus roseus TaxID=1737570 RepID=UPI000C7EE8BF|nr:PHB depolymerase family esterase [Kandeliimicrobium roseum]
MFRAPLLALALSVLMGDAVTAGCGPSPDACTVASGTYHAVLPAGGGQGAPVVIFLHGAGGSGADTLRNTGMVEAIRARGYALLAPDGLSRQGRRGGGWSFLPGHEALRDEPAFFAEVAGDAVARFGVDRDRVLLAGFSIGGSMVAYTACARPDLFAAYAPVAGNFWRPHPEGCAGPVKLFHTHGWQDVTVPLEGRPLRGGAIEQGDVWAAMEIWRATDGCTMMRPDGFDTVNQFWIRRWTDCAPGAALQFALHPGAHGIPVGWADLALDWFEGLARRPE